MAAVEYKTLIYLIISERSRLFPPRNAIPINNKNMSKEKLIDQVKKAFENELYVGDNDIVYNNSPGHLECSELKKAFIGQNWQDVTHNTIFNNKDSLPFFSIDGLKYYTPIFYNRYFK
ncbi:hypothetical protein [Sphingobacterium spiritivorum]|nr:hypothetical protein [Sphingobacterium spiritivorum]